MAKTKNNSPDVLQMEDVVLCPKVGGMYAIRKNPRRFTSDSRITDTKTWSIFWWNGTFLCEFLAPRILNAMHLDAYRMPPGTKIDNACRYVWLRLQNNPDFPEKSKSNSVIIEGYDGIFALITYRAEVCGDSHYVLFDKTGKIIGKVVVEETRDMIGHRMDARAVGYITDLQRENGWSEIRESVYTILSDDYSVHLKAARSCAEKLVEHVSFLLKFNDGYFLDGTM